MRLLFFLEVPPRFELGDEGFADPSLTTWLWHRAIYSTGETVDPSSDFLGFIGSPHAADPLYMGILRIRVKSFI